MACNTNKKIYRTFYIAEASNSTITLFKNRTYHLNLGLAGSSDGRWKKEENKIIINSYYKCCCIESINMFISPVDSSSFTTFHIIGEDGSGPPSIIFFDKNEKAIDTIHMKNNITKTDSFVFYGRSPLIIQKDKEYAFIKLITPNWNGTDAKWNKSFASSTMIKYSFSDSIYLGYHYNKNPSDICFDNKTYIIKGKYLK